MRELHLQRPVALDSHASREDELLRAVAYYKARYEQIVNAAYEGIWEVDAHGKTLFANRRMAEMLGYSLDELLHLSLFDVSHPEDHDNAREGLQKRLTGAAAQHDWRFVRKDGTDLWCIVAASPTFDEHGKPTGAFGMVTDITERKRAEQRLQRVSRLYAVASAVSEAIVRIRDPQQLYDYACRIAVELGQVSFAWIGIRDVSTGELHLAGRCGGTDEYVDQVMQRVRTESANAGPGRRAFRDGSINVSNDIANDPTFYWKDTALRLGLRSCAVFPLKSAETVTGIMAIYANQAGYFSDEELRVLKSLVDDIAFAVESANKRLALQEQERMVATLFTTLPGMTYRCRNDDHWTLEIVSPGCFDLTGYRVESLLGNRDISYEQLIDPADREGVRTHVLAAIDSRRPFELTYRIRTAKGELKWVWERGVGVFDENGTLRFLEGFITDITARREAEAQVAAQAELLDKATDAIVLYGIDDVVYYWNHGAERLYGWSAREAIGEKITRLTCRDSAQRRALQAKVLERDEWSGELTHLTKDGHEVVVDASWTLVRDDSGAPQSILAINTNITQRKRLEAQFLTTQRLESIGTLAGGIAHDFNNILTAITGNTKLALSDTPAQHPLRPYLHEIEKASLRATDLVRQILTFSRRQEAQRRVIDLQDVVSEALRLLRATLPAQIEIHAEYHDTPRILGDGTQIHQVIINLGTNAAHAMRERGGVLAVAIKGVTLAENAVPNLPAGRYAQLSVSDSGVGMDAAIIERIFEPFFTTKTQGQGTGLGLSVVHGIVRSHEGSISVDSELGRGTRFTIYFPEAHPVAHQALAETQDVIPRASSGQHILYVDDEEALVFLTTRVLERLGYRVTGRNDARQALDDFKRCPQQFDAVVSDLSMPGMTGPELARAVLTIRPDIPIVLTSGYIRDEDMKIARELNIREVVLKPNTVEDLGATLHRVLNS